jgi:hypothetical protein
MTQQPEPPRPAAVRSAGAAVAVVAALAGLAALGNGLSLRFHIENTSEAIAEEARGGRWVLAAAGLLLIAAGAARWAHVPWWPVALITAPVFFGSVPALLLPGNIIPFGTALLAALLTATGLIATVVYAIIRRR